MYFLQFSEPVHAKNSMGINKDGVVADHGRAHWKLFLA